jgi:hypothetical protein
MPPKKKEKGLTVGKAKDKKKKKKKESSPGNLDTRLVGLTLMGLKKKRRSWKN